MRAKILAIFLMLFCVGAFAQTSVQFLLTDPQFGLAQTTNIPVTVQALNVQVGGPVTLLPFRLTQYSDTNGQTTFTNLFGSTNQGFYQYSIPISQSGPPSRGYFWVSSTNLGTVPVTLIQVVFGANTYPSGWWTYSATAADQRYAPSATNLASYVQIGQLNSASNAIVALIPSTNGFATASITNGFASTNWVFSYFYPTSNPSQFVTASITNFFIPGNWVTANQFIFGTNWVATNDAANLILTSNALASASTTASNALQAALIATNSAILKATQPTNSILTALGNTGANTNNYIAVLPYIYFQTNLSGNTVSISGTNIPSTNGLATTNFVAAGYYPLSNPSNYITLASVPSTNGLATTNWVGVNYYPTSNPSGFVTSAITNGLASTNAVVAATNGITGTAYAPVGSLMSTNLLPALTNNFVGTNYVNGISNYLILTLSLTNAAILQQATNLAAAAQLFSTNYAYLLFLQNSNAIVISNSVTASNAFAELFAATNGFTVQMGGVVIGPNTNTVFTQQGSNTIYAIASTVVAAGGSNSIATVTSANGSIIVTVIPISAGFTNFDLKVNTNQINTFVPGGVVGGTLVNETFSQSGSNTIAAIASTYAGEATNAWGFGGNSVTNAFIGTLTQQPFQIVANDAVVASLWNLTNYSEDYGTEILIGNLVNGVSISKPLPANPIGVGIFGGDVNNIQNETRLSYLFGGFYNQIVENNSSTANQGIANTIVGGSSNLIRESTVGSGDNNNAIIGGTGNILDDNATIPGSTTESVIAGGYSNYMGGAESFMAGIRGSIQYSNTFMWSDGSQGVIQSITNNQVIFIATNGFSINTVNPQGYALNVNGPVNSSTNYYENGIPLGTSAQAGSFYSQVYVTGAAYTFYNGIYTFVGGGVAIYTNDANTAAILLPGGYSFEGTGFGIPTVYGGVFITNCATVGIITHTPLYESYGSIFGNYTNGIIGASPPTPAPTVTPYNPMQASSFTNLIGTNLNNGTLGVAPELFGAVADTNPNQEADTNDNTAALQYAINWAEQNNARVVIKHPYRILGTLLVTNALAIEGSGVSWTSGSWSNANYSSLAYPLVYPYLTGAVLLECGTNKDVVDITNVGSSFSMDGIGVRFGTNVAFANTGNGFYAYPPQMPLGGYDIGIHYSHWKNCSVWGNDGNHYSFYVANGMYNTFEGLSGIGGGGFCYECNGTNQGGNIFYPGNADFNECDFVMCTAGSGKGMYFKNTNVTQGALGYVSLTRCQAIAWLATGDYPWVTPLQAASLTSTQNIFQIDSGSYQVTVGAGCAWENSYGGGPAVFSLNTGDEYLPMSVPNLLTNFTGSYGSPAMTPHVFSGPISWGKNNNPNKAILLNEWADNNSGGPYYDGFDYDSVNARLRVFQTFQSTNGNFGFDYDVLNKTGTVYTNVFHVDQAGNITNTGTITANGGFIGSGSGLTNVTASGLTGTISISNLVVTNATFLAVITSNLTVTGTISQSGAGTNFFAATNNMAGLNVTNNIVVQSGNFTVSSGIISGNGSGIIDLSASAITGTIPAGNMPAFSGDITTSAGSTVTALKNTGTAGTYTKTTFDANGRETSGTTLSLSDLPANIPSAGLNWNGGTNLAGIFSNSTATTLNTLYVNGPETNQGPVVFYSGITDNTLTASSPVFTDANKALTSTGTVPLSDIAQGGAATSQVLGWNGSVWAPTTASGGSGSNSTNNPVHVIVLTSIGDDPDQITGCAMLGALQDMGYIVVDAYANDQGPYSANYAGTANADAVLTYYGINPVISSSTNSAVSYSPQEYTSVNSYASRYNWNSAYPNATLSLRQAFAQHPGDTFFAAGPAQAIQDFLQSPADQIYPGTGSNLLANNCAAMGTIGGYWTNSPSGSPEFNLSTGGSSDAAYGSEWPPNVQQYWIDFSTGTNMLTLNTNWNWMLQAQSPLAIALNQATVSLTGRAGWSSLTALIVVPQFRTNLWGTNVGYIDTGYTNNITLSGGAVGSNCWTLSATSFQNHIHYTNYVVLSNFVNSILTYPAPQWSANAEMIASGITSTDLWPKMYVQQPELNAATGTQMTNIFHTEFETGAQPWFNQNGYWTNNIGGQWLDSSAANGLDYHITSPNNLLGTSSAVISNGSGGSAAFGFCINTNNTYPTNSYFNAYPGSSYFHAKIKLSASPSGQVSVMMYMAPPFILGSGGQSAAAVINSSDKLVMYNGSSGTATVNTVPIGVPVDIYSYYGTTGTSWACFSTDGSIPTSGNNYTSVAASHTTTVAGYALNNPNGGSGVNIYFDNVIASTNPIPAQYPGNLSAYFYLSNPLTQNVVYTNLTGHKLWFKATYSDTNSSANYYSACYLTNYVSGDFSASGLGNSTAITNEPTTLPAVFVNTNETVGFTNLSNCQLLGSRAWDVYP